MKEERAWREAAAARGSSSRSRARSAAATASAVVPGRLATGLACKVRWALGAPSSAPETAPGSEILRCAGAGGFAF